MSKTIKGNKGKIPRLTEAEYAEYIALLKTSDDTLKKMDGEKTYIEGQQKDMASIIKKPR